MNPYFSAAKVLRIIFITAAALLLVAAFQWYRSFDAPTGDPYVSPRQRLELLRTSAAANFKRETTNTVGYRRTLSESLNNYDDDAKKWSARARVEYINRAGGVEVTNLLFYFQPHYFYGESSALCLLDLRWQKPLLETIRINSLKISDLESTEQALVAVMETNDKLAAALKVGKGSWPEQQNLRYATNLGHIRAELVIARLEIQQASGMLAAGPR